MLSREAPYRRRAPEPAARALKLIAALALAAGLIAGCGEGGDSTTASGTTAPPAASGTELVVTLDADGKGGKPPQQRVVSCPGSGREVCDAIAGLPANATSQTPPNSPCTQIYGGPDTLVVQGRLNGDPVNARLSRSDGCEIERFDRFVPMLKALYPDYEPGAALAP